MRRESYTGASKQKKKVEGKRGREKIICNGGCCMLLLSYCSQMVSIGSRLISAAN